MPSSSGDVGLTQITVMPMIVSRRAALELFCGALLVPATTFAEAPPALFVTTADGRRCQVSVWRAPRRRGTILFSHGALSSPAKYTALIEPWAASGYDVWAPLHVDSTDHPDTKRFPGLASWPARIEDMRALAHHVGARHYVAAGHSYGALVALTLSGASPTPPPGVAGPLADPRVTAAVAFSPPGPGMGLIDAAGYATLARPALIETGTRDLPPGTTDPDAWRGHLAAFDAPPPGGDRYALVLDGADHYFGGIICRPELPGPRQQAQFEQALAVSRLFLRGFGSGEAGARAALNRRLANTGPIMLRRK